MNISNGTTIRTQILARNSTMAVVMVTKIVSMIVHLVNLAVSRATNLNHMTFSQHMRHHMVNKIETKLSVIDQQVKNQMVAIISKKFSVEFIYLGRIHD